MDLFGIGSAVRGAMRIYFMSARSTGRTTRLVEILESGDTVVCVDTAQARRIVSLCKDNGQYNVDYIIVDPKYPDNVYHVLAGKEIQGRLIFDHVWIEQYYLHAIDSNIKYIDGLKNRFSGKKNRLTIQTDRRWPR